MKVILFVIGDMNIGGAEKQLFELISNLDKEKFKPILLCMNSFGYYAELLKKGYKIDTLFLNSKKSMDFKRLFYIGRIIKKEKVDLVHSWRYEANMYVGLIKLILPNLKWVSTERSAGPTNANSRIKIIEKFIMQKSNIIITNSKAGINYLNKILNIENEKICLIHNGLRKNDDKKT